MLFQLHKSVNEQIVLPSEFGVELFIKREDAIHPYISGNKYRKLKYNILEAQNLGLNTLLTFGGAFSNHIAAVASLGKEYGLNTIGIIRGEELKDKINDNQTLLLSRDCGMQFKFVSRELYRDKASKSYITSLNREFGGFYMIPEGGTNELAIKGCEEILTGVDNEFDYICTSIGTGGTISGLINCSQPGQQVLGFPALKGDFLKEDISKFVIKKNWSIISDYHFGGYAKLDEALVHFMNRFKKDNNIQLDPVYTGKMMFGIFDLIEKGYFQKGSKILAIHTGGLQGIIGMNNVLRKKGMLLIE